MAKAKSPFMVYQHFLSPKICETVVDSLGFFSPDRNPQGKPIKMFRYHEQSEDLIFKRFEKIIPDISRYYGFDHRGTEQMTFEYLAQGTISDPLCENSNYIQKKWLRTKDRDITCVIFLVDYNDHPPFDSDFEVYGGKLEFPQHGFGFNPEWGTMVVYPSGPHFINANAEIFAGDLVQVRFHLAGKLPYLYNPHNFPGNYLSWFNHLQ